MNGVIFWICVLLIVYTWAGFPALLFIFATVKKFFVARLPAKDQAPPQHQLPTVSLIIAAYNEQAVIGQKIENALQLNYPAARLQIIIADDGSSDDTPNITQRYQSKGVKLNRDARRRGKSAAVDRAVKEASGEILLFSDANNMYSPDTLQEMVKPFQKSQIGGVTGRHILQGEGALSTSEGFYWKYEAFIRKLESELGTVIGVTGDVLAIRAQLYQPVPEHIINQDFYMAMRVLKQGYNIAFAPKAQSFEHVSPAIEDEIRRRARIVAGRYQAFSMSNDWLPWKRPFILWQILSKKGLRPLVAWAMIAAILTNLIAIIFPQAGQDYALLYLAHPFNWVFFWAQSLFYLLAIIGVLAGKRQGILSKLLYMPTYFVGNNFASIIGLFHYAFGRQTQIWQRTPRPEEQFTGQSTEH